MVPRPGDDATRLDLLVSSTCCRKDAASTTAVEGAITACVRHDDRPGALGFVRADGLGHRHASAAAGDGGRLTTGTSADEVIFRLCR